MKISHGSWLNNKKAVEDGKKKGKTKRFTGTIDGLEIDRVLKYVNGWLRFAGKIGPLF